MYLCSLFHLPLSLLCTIETGVESCLEVGVWLLLSFFSPPAPLLGVRRLNLLDKFSNSMCYSQILTGANPKRTETIRFGRISQKDRVKTLSFRQAFYRLY